MIHQFGRDDVTAVVKDELAGRVRRTGHWRNHEAVVDEGAPDDARPRDDHFLGLLPRVRCNGRLREGDAR